MIRVNFTTRRIDIALYVNKHVSCGNVTISLHIITAFKQRVNVGQVGTGCNVPIIAHIIMQPFFIWANNRIYSCCTDGPRISARNFPVFRFSPTIQIVLHISIWNLKLIGFSESIIYFNRSNLNADKWPNKVSINNIVCDIPICNKYYFYLRLLTLSQIS